MRRPDTGTELDRRFDGGAREAVETVQAAGVEQLAHHDLGQRAAGLVVAAQAARPLGPPDHHVAGQPRQHGPGLGQAHLPAVPQEAGQQAEAPDPDTRRQGARPLQVSQAGEEVLHIAVAQGGRVGSGVGASRQVLGQQPDGADDRAYRPGGLGGERLGRPRLGRRLQPRLGDGPGRPAAGAAMADRAGERQPPGGAPQSQVPDVFGLLGPGVGAGQASPVGGECEEPPDRGARRGRADGVGHAAGPGMAQVPGHVPQGRGHDPPALAQRRLDTVEHLGDHALVEPGQHHPAAAVPQAGRGGSEEHRQLGAAREPPGPVVGSAHAAVPAGRQPLARRHGAGSQARPGCGAREVLVAQHECLNALPPSAALTVTAQAQVVHPHGSFEAGDPADQAPPVTRTVLPADAGLAEGLDVGPAARTKAIAASGAQTARVPRLQLAAGDPADRVAEQGVLPVRRQGLRRRIPAGDDEQRVVDRPGEPVPAQVPLGAGRYLAQRPHVVACPKSRGPSRSTAAR